MSRSAFGWDLPPGCSAADIDRAAGAGQDEAWARGAEVLMERGCPECRGPMRIADEDLVCTALDDDGYLCEGRYSCDRIFDAGFDDEDGNDR